MKYTHSNEYPVTRKLQGVYQVPVDVQEVTDEEGNVSYKYVIYKFDKLVPNIEVIANHKHAKAKYYELLSQGCEITSLGFKIDCMDNNVSDFVGKLVATVALGKADDEIILVRDYNNVIHEVTVAQFKVLCGELDDYVTNCRITCWADVDAVGV